MSFKSKAKATGIFLLKYLGPQAVYFLVDKVATRSAANAAKTIVGAYTGTLNTAKPPPKIIREVHQDLDKLLHEKVKPVLDRERDAMMTELRAEVAKQLRSPK